MSISSTAEVNETATVGHDNSQKSPNLSGEGAPQENSIETNEVLALPVQAKSLETVTHPAPQDNRPSFIPGNSALAVSKTANSSEILPVSNSLQVADIVFMIGNRPVGPSHLHIDHTEQMSGLRPIASNDTEDADTLIGYLD